MFKVTETKIRTLPNNPLNGLQQFSIIWENIFEDVTIISPIKRMSSEINIEVDICSQNGLSYFDFAIFKKIDFCLNVKANGFCFYFTFHCAWWGFWWKHHPFAGGANTSQSGYLLMDNWSIATTGRLYTNWLNDLCIVNEMSQCQLINYIQTGQRYIVIILVYI